MAISDWFDALRVVNQKAQYSWLANLQKPHDNIVNFGCSSGCEPFALLWILQAKKITVVEIDNIFLGELDQQKEILENTYPLSLKGRSITSLNRDMTLAIPELPDNHFDLAYCEDVLYAIELNLGIHAVEKAIGQMVRVVKQNGWVIAVEPKFRAEFETRNSDVLGIPISIPVRKTEPEDMSRLFESKRLEKAEISEQPQFSYCYRRV